FSSAGFQTDEIAVRAESINPFALHRRRRTRGWKAGFLLGVSDLAQAAGPNRRAAVRGESANRLVLQTLAAQQINPFAHDRSCRVTGAGIRNLPEQFRALLGPFF